LDEFSKLGQFFLKKPKKRGKKKHDFSFFREKFSPFFEKKNFNWPYPFPESSIVAPLL
jgi:hypothetical protein